MNRDALIEAALWCIADTSWCAGDALAAGVEPNPRSMLYHALRDLLGHDAMRTRIDEKHAVIYVYQRWWCDMWLTFARIGADAAGWGKP